MILLTSEQKPPRTNSLTTLRFTLTHSERPAQKAAFSRAKADEPTRTSFHGSEPAPQVDRFTGRYRRDFARRPRPLLPADVPRRFLRKAAGVEP